MSEPKNTEFCHRKTPKNEIMKQKIFAATLLLAAAMTASAQTNEPSDTTKKTKAEAREETYRNTIAALEAGDFVFQTEKMVAGNASRAVAEVDSTANFIAVKQNEGVLQIAPPVSSSNPTILTRTQQPLRILNRHLSFDKRGNATCTLGALIGNDPQTITIRLNKRRRDAVATGAENSFVLLGRIVPSDKATIEPPKADVGKTE